MSNRIISYLILFLPAFYSCTKNNSEIHVACERDEGGNYLVKWETYPPIEGTVKIFQSSNLDFLPQQTTVIEEDIKNGYTTIRSRFLEPRQYFKLVFNKKHSIITAERVINTEGLYNLRDIGGYYSRNKAATLWGKLFRSSSMSNATPYDIEILNELGIKSSIDLRTNRQCNIDPSKYRAPHTFNIPLEGDNAIFSINEITFKEKKRGDILVALQDLQLEILHKNTKQFIRVFDALLDENNYPMLIYCTWGKDRTSMVVALILSALEVPYEQILQDYLLSNDYTYFNHLILDADLYEDSVQEGLTVLLSSHEEVLNYVFEQINKEYGSINNYLEKELHLTSKKREKLKNLLLDQEIE